MKFLKIIKSFTLSFSCTGLLASPVFADTFTGANGATASGTAAIAIGLDASATGLYSIAIGKDTSAASPTASATPGACHLPSSS